MPTIAVGALHMRHPHRVRQTRKSHATVTARYGDRIFPATGVITDEEFQKGKVQLLG